jgi:photosystem II stability/assembly factor-like uncharacterized protein
MRSIVLSLFLLFSLISSIRSQIWTPHWQSGDFQYSNNFIEGENFGYAAFENFFFRLNEHGNSWSTVYYEPLKKFVSLDFQDTQHGWAIMEDQFVWSVRETNDGGGTWIQHGNLPEGFGNFYVLEAYDDSNILAATNSRVFRSTDSGETWTEVLLLGDGVTGLYFQNANTAWASGGNGKVYRSTNAGLTWSLININVTTYGVNDIQFSDTGNIYALIGGGYGGIRKSTNNGSTWTELPTGIINQAMYVETDNTIYVSSLSGIFKTINGGSTWSNVHSWPQNRSTYHFYSINASELILAGFGGQIYKTVNNGSSWTEVNSGFGYVTGMDVLSSSEIWAIGSSNLNSTVMHSTNGGENWHLTTAPAGISAIDFVDPSTGFAIGNSGLVKTADGGQTWTVKNASITNGKIVAIDPLNVHVLSNNNTVHNSFDGGETWSTGSFNVALPLVVFPLYDMEFTSTLIGRLSGDSGYVYYTSDGGVNWIKNTTLVTSIDLPECFYISNNIGWHSTLDIVYKTTNGGASWSTINIPTLIGYLSSLHFYDAQHGMGVDSFGGEFRLMETSNGGSTWTDVSPSYLTTQSVGAIWRSNDDVGFISSPDLGILRKDNSLCPLPVFTATLQVENPQACIGGTGFISFDTEASVESVEWYRNGELLSTNTTLVISNVDAGDTGLYECHLTDSNECGTYEFILYSYFTAIENVAPTLTISSSDYAMCQGESFALNVETSYGNVVSAMWYQNGSYIGQGNPFTVSNVQAFQAGNYSCSCFISSVCGSFTVESDDISIDILDNYELFSSAPVEFDFLCVGQIFEATASGFGYPNIQFEWYSNNLLISTTETLSFESLPAEMNGLLELHVIGLGGCQNAIDEYQWNIQVIPIAEVYPPSLPYQIVPVCFGESVTLYYESDVMPDFVEWYRGESMMGAGNQITVNVIDEFYYGDYYCIAYYGNDCGYNTETSLVYTLVDGETVSLEPTNAGTILTPCGEDIYLSFNSVYEIDTYEWVHNGVLIGNGQDIVLTPGEHYYGELYCTVSSSNSCGSAIETFLMYTIFQSEPYPLNYNIESQYYGCEGFPIEISVDANTTFPGVVEYSWLENGIEVSNDPSFTYVPASSGNHEIELVLTVISVCETTQVNETINITAFDGPELPSESFTQSLLVCESDNVLLECDIIVPLATMSYEWFLDGVSVGEGNSILIDVNENSEGVYSCLVMAIAPCGLLAQEYDLYELIVSYNPVVDPYFSNMELSGCPGDILEMTYQSQDEPYLVEWFLNDELVFTGTNIVFEASENSSGEYYVYAYAANDCGTDESINVLMYTVSIDGEVDLPDDPGAIEMNICTGPLELAFTTSIEGATYSWSNDNGFLGFGQTIVIDEPIEGIYQCSVSLSNNCGSATQVYNFANVSLNEISTPFVNIDDQLSVEDIYSTYEWYFNDVIIGSTSTVDNQGPGEYTLIVTNEAGCSNTQNFVITSTNELDQINVNVYPNPAADNVTIALSERASRVVIYNQLGEKLRDMSVSESDLIRVDVSTFPNGVYHLEVYAGEKRYLSSLQVIH